MTDEAAREMVLARGNNYMKEGMKCKLEQYVFWSDSRLLNCLIGDQMC